MYKATLTLVTGEKITFTFDEDPHSIFNETIKEGKEQFVKDDRIIFMRHVVKIEFDSKEENGKIGY